MTKNEFVSTITMMGWKQSSLKDVWINGLNTIAMYPDNEVYIRLSKNSTLGKPYRTHSFEHAIKMIIENSL